MPTDEEVICAWMEAKPEHSREFTAGRPWWVWLGSQNDWIPNKLTLDALHEAETRLTEDQQWSYIERMANIVGTFATWYSLHATAAQKIKALAAVIREVLNAQNGTPRDASPAVPILEDGAK